MRGSQHKGGLGWPDGTCCGRIGGYVNEVAPGGAKSAASAPAQFVRCLLDARGFERCFKPNKID